MFVFKKDQPITSFPIAVHKFHARESPTSRDKSEPRSAIHERVDNDDDETCLIKINLFQKQKIKKIKELLYIFTTTLVAYKQH